MSKEWRKRIHSLQFFQNLYGKVDEKLIVSFSHICMRNVSFLTDLVQKRVFLDTANPELGIGGFWGAIKYRYYLNFTLTHGALTILCRHKMLEREIATSDSK